ncbi:MAG TPA: sigma-70 family RNA polymerase sigma factor [Patescibacteria group bacterium]|nr:sigma-70 family RNA polymerase sigma factor [Patescibacteria group bacterium]
MLVALSLRWGARPVSPGRDIPPQEPDEIPAADGMPAGAAAGQAAALPADPAAARTFVEGLFARHHGEIHAYLTRMLRDPELAADLTQDAFIRAYRAHADLDDVAKARAWLYQIAHRVALDEIRRRKIIRFVQWSGESRGSSPSAERLVLDARLSGDLERALGRIPERQRSALLLAEVHEMTGLELAAALGTSHVAARALLTRARESLRRALAEEKAASAERDVAAARSTRPDHPRAARR